MARHKIENPLLPIMRVLIESAALQLIVETFTLALCIGNYTHCGESSDLKLWWNCYNNVCHLKGITLNAIAMHIKLRTIGNSTIYTKADPVKTIGSMPMKRITADDITE